MILHLRAAVQQLYAAPPARFTPLRAELAAQAKAAGDSALAKDIAALRKPTLSAWALNTYVRGHPDEMDEFGAFAELLREAQRTLDADQLRVLGRERSRRVGELAGLVAAAAGAAGQPLGPAPTQEVHDTLTALVADEDAERSIRTGALVRPLRYSGFGSVDIEGVLAHPAAAGEDEDEDVAAATRPADPGRPPAAAPAAADAADLEARRARRREEERRRLVAALGDASRALETADTRVDVLTARHGEVVEGLADLERRLAAARRRLDAVAAELEEARGIRDARRDDETSAEAALEAHDQADDQADDRADDSRQE